MFKDKQAKSSTGNHGSAQYLKSSHISCWLGLALVAILMTIFIAWALIGTITTSKNIKCINENGHAITFIAPADKLDFKLNQKVLYNGQDVGEITNFGLTVLTNDQVKSMVNNDNFYNQLNTNVANIDVHMEVDGTIVPQGIVELEIVFSEKKPIELLFG